MTDEQYEEAAAFWKKKDAEAKQMEPEKVKEWIDAFLHSHKVLALAAGSGETIRCTPLEYTWHDGALWIFTEGGLKFRALQENSHVSAAVFETNADFGGLKSLQIEGTAEIPELFSEEYIEEARVRSIPLETLRKLPEPMWLLKITPSEITCLDSGFRKDGYGSRQHWKAREGAETA